MSVCTIFEGAFDELPENEADGFTMTSLCT